MSLFGGFRALRVSFTNPHELLPLLSDTIERAWSGNTVLLGGHWRFRFLTRFSGSVAPFCERGLLRSCAVCFTVERSAEVYRAEDHRIIVRSRGAALRLNRFIGPASVSAEVYSLLTLRYRAILA